MANRIFYSGDVNVEYGGMFYTLTGYKAGCVDAVRVIPCSDAGGPDNCYWVESLTINIMKGAALDSVLDVCGMDKKTLPHGAAKKHALIEAHAWSGACDIDSTLCVQIGAKQDYSREPVVPDLVLRGNASLAKFARKFLKGGG